MTASITKRELESMVDLRYGKIIAESLPADASGTLIIFGHEYRAAEQQENLFLELDHLIQIDPGMPIFLEGHSGPRSEWPEGQAEEQAKPGGMQGFLQRFSRPAEKTDRRNDPIWRAEKGAGLLAVKGTLATKAIAELFPKSATLFGAEEDTLFEAQKNKIGEIDAQVRDTLARRGMKMNAGALIVTVFSGIMNPIVKNLQSHLNAKLLQLMDRRSKYLEDGRATLYAAELAEMARMQGISLQAYPAVDSLSTAMKMEASLDFNAVEAERQELIEKLVDLSGQQLDDDHASAVRRWLEFAPPEEKALAGVYGEATEADLGSSWLARLVTISQAFRDKKYTYAQFHMRLKELMDSLGIDCPETSSLGKYINYVILSEQFDLNALISTELGALHYDLADIFTTSAPEKGILKLGAELDDLFRFFSLAFPAQRIQAFIAKDPSLDRWFQEACMLENAIPGAASAPEKKKIAQNAVPFVDELLPAIREYYRLASLRSAKLIQNVLNTNLTAVRMATLVCGRFHLHEITQTLTNQSRLGWAVIAPMPVRYSKEQKLQNWNWIYPSQEFSLAEEFEQTPA